jgi:hypothetical protein
MSSQERNARVFRNTTTQPTALLNSIKFEGDNWMKPAPSASVVSFLSN